MVAVRFHESGRDSLVNATFDSKREAEETKENVVDIDTWLAVVRARFALALTLTDTDIERQRITTHLRHSA